MSNLRAIVFDLDDTLYEERSFVLSGFRAAAEFAAETNVTISADHLFGVLTRLFTDGVRGDTFRQALTEIGHFSDSFEEELVEAYRGHSPAISPYPEVPNVIAALSKRFELGLLSDGYLEVQKRKFAALGLDQFFTGIVFSDELGRSHWKPSRKPFELVLQRLGNPIPAQTAYVADNATKDFLGANELGMSTIWLRRGEGEYASQTPPTKAHQPDREIRSMHDLEAVIETL